MWWYGYPLHHGTITPRYRWEHSVYLRYRVTDENCVWSTQYYIDWSRYEFWRCSEAPDISQRYRRCKNRLIYTGWTFSDEQTSEYYGRGIRIRKSRLLSWDRPSSSKIKIIYVLISISQLLTSKLTDAYLFHFPLMDEWISVSSRRSSVSRIRICGYRQYFPTMMESTNMWDLQKKR